MTTIGRHARNGPVALRTVFSALLAGVLLASMDQSLISTELPTIVGDLSGLREQVWATTSYLLAATVALPVIGKLGDAVGRRAPFLAAVSVFTAASVGCALAPTFAVFVLCRGAQGLGAGGMLVLAQAIVAELVPPRSRSRYLGALGAVFGLATVAGPLLGGWFIDHLDWRWSFLLNAPVGAAVLIAVLQLRLLIRPRRARIDLPGMGLLTVMLSSLIVAIDSGGSGSGWFSVPTLSWAAVSVVAGVALARVERAASDPVLPVTLLTNRAFLTATAIGALAGVGMFALIGLLPSYLQFSRGASATGSGLLLLPIIAGLVVMALGSGALISRWGRAQLYPALGSIVSGTALLLLAGSVLTAPLWTVELDLFVLGSGLGLIIQNVISIAQSSAPSRDLGVATGLTTTARELGGAVGASVFGSAYAAHVFAGLTGVFRRAGLSAQQSTIRSASLRPQLMHLLPASVRLEIVDVYAHSLQSVIWLLLPFALLGTVLALTHSWAEEKAGGRTDE